MWLRMLLVGLVACAPVVDGPVERGRAIDRDDGDRLSLELARLPGVTHAHASLHRPIRDPLAPSIPVAAPSAAVIVLVDDATDIASVTAAAGRLIHGTAPDIAEPSIVVAIAATRPELAHVGPFTVETRSRSLLVTVLVGGLAVICALASWIAWTTRPGLRG